MLTAFGPSRPFPSWLCTQELAGPFQLAPGERHMLLQLARRRDLTNTQRQWADVEHPVSTVGRRMASPKCRIYQA